MGFWYNLVRTSLDKVIAFRTFELVLLVFPQRRCPRPLYLSGWSDCTDMFGFLHQLQFQYTVDGKYFRAFVFQVMSTLVSYSRVSHGQTLFKHTLPVV